MPTTDPNGLPRGIYRTKDGKRYQARVRTKALNGHRGSRSIGTFETTNEALTAQNRWQPSC